MDRQEFFDSRAKVWDSERDPQEDARLNRVVALAEVLWGQAVLDVATGTGVLIPHLLEAIGPSGRITGLDLSRGMLEMARRKAFPPNVTLVQANVHNIPLPETSFDRVICNAALPHFEDFPQSLKEMVRILKPGGVLVISFPIGREAVNKIHQNVGGAVKNHRVPMPEMMVEMLKQAGLIKIWVIDEPEFYLAFGKKPRPALP